MRKPSSSACLWGALSVLSVATLTACGSTGSDDGAESGAGGANASGGTPASGGSDATGSGGQTTASGGQAPASGGSGGQVLASGGAGGSDGTGGSESEGCEAGTFDDDDDTSTPCVAYRSCPAGQVVAAEGTATEDRVCTACAAGTFSTSANSAACAELSDCTPGQYVLTEGSTESDRVCAECPDDLISTTENASICLEPGACPAGTLQTSPGSASTPPTCEPCEAGTFCAGGENAKIACSGESFDDDQDATTACLTKTLCLAGNFVDSSGSATSDRTCAPCSAGTWSDTDNAASCKPHHECAPGEYVTVDPSADSDRQCGACSSGTFAATKNATSCADWGDCAPGTFVSNTPSSSADRVCMACAMGTFTDKPNLSQCLDADACPAGTVQTAPPGPSTPATCDACAAGNYCAGDTAPQVPCSASTYDDDQQSATACVTKTNCVPGERIQSAGDATTDRSCAACADGSFSSAANSASCTSWTSCSPGSGVTQAGSATQNRTCSACGAGTFSSGTNGTCQAWTVCGPGQSEIAAGTASSDRVCGSAPQTTQWGTTLDDQGQCIAIDGADNIFVAGSTTGSLGKANAGQQDGFVSKMSPNGTVVWSAQWGGTYVDIAYGIATDAAGNIFAVGYTQNALGAFFGSTDAYLTKVNPDGSIAWIKQWGTGASDIATGVSVDAAGNIYVGGYTEGVLGAATAGGRDAFVTKLSPDGTIVWSTQWGSTALDQARGVAVTPDGTVFAAGYTLGTLPGNTASGGEDGFVTKLNPDGTIAWTKQVGTSQNDQYRGISTDGAGNAVAAGYTSGSIARPTNGFTDAFATKFASDGSIPWHVQWGSTSSDLALGASHDAAGNIYVAGYTQGALAAGNAGSQDLFVSKLSPAGSVLWSRQLGTSGSDIVFDAVVSTVGTVYVGGYTGGSLAIPNNGAGDLIVTRYTQP